MKIINSVYGDSTGGRWAAALKTAELLASNGHEVILLIAPCDQHKVPSSLPPSIKVTCMRNSGHYDLIASIKARRLIKKCGIDAIIAHSGRAIWLLKRAAPSEVPVIAFNHSHNIKRTLKADAFFCVTPYMRQLVDQATGGSKPSFVISNAVSIPDATLLQPIIHKTPVVGLIGRLTDGKGTLYLLQALALLRDRGLVLTARIAGTGEEMDMLKAACQDLGLSAQIEFLGWVGDTDKAAFFNSVDFLCFTSYRDVQPLVLLEMMAWGKAIIGNDLEGPASIYEHNETALVVPTRNVPALAEAIALLASDHSLRERLGHNARIKAERCHADAAVATLLNQHISELVSQHLATT